MHAMTRASSFTREQLLASARGELFPNSTARLPADPMLMFDRITEIRQDGGAHGKGMVRAELDIHPDLWFFQCHFLGDPVMPGCLGLDAMWQLSGFFLPWLGEPGLGRALGVGEEEFRRHTADLPFFMSLGYLRIARLPWRAAERDWLLQEAEACLAAGPGR